MKDKLNREIKVNDYIAYAKAQGRAAYFDIYHVREVLPDGIKGYILDEKNTYAAQAKLQKYIYAGDRYVWVDKSPKEIEKTLQKTTKITKGSQALVLDNFNPDLYNLV